MKGWNAILQKRAMISGWNVNYKIYKLYDEKPKDNILDLIQSSLVAFDFPMLFSDLDKQLMQTKTQRNLYREALGKFSSFPISYSYILTKITTIFKFQL